MDPKNIQDIQIPIAAILDVKLLEGPVQFVFFEGYNSEPFFQ